MIIRILSEGQYLVDDEAMAQLNRYDAEVEAAVRAGDQEKLTAALTKLLEQVRELGEQVPDDILADSDEILPDASATVDEVRAWLDEAGSGEGLLPG